MARKLGLGGGFGARYGTIARRQHIEIPGASLYFRMEEGETIWTESSHKYSPHEPAQMAAGAGFRQIAQWTDHEWRFAQNLWIVA